MWQELKSNIGTYALTYACKESRSIRIGKLGTLKLSPGYYLYIGSAFGPGGIKARICHHLSESSSPHWHVDYLKPHCDLLELWVTYSNTKRERAWVSTLSKSKDASIPLMGFGSSDTSADSHLFFFKAQPQASILKPGTVYFLTYRGEGAAPT